MKCVCPICNEKYENVVNACQQCGFFDKYGINRIFINSEDAEIWNNTVVEPYRMKRQFDRMGSVYGKQSKQIYDIRMELKEALLWREQAEKRIDKLEKIIAELTAPPKQPEAPLPPLFEKTPKVGDIVEFGRFDWRVLMLVKGNRALLISNQILEKRAYHGDFEATTRAERSITWEKSALRQYLNGRFLEGFDKKERSRIVATRNVTAGSEDTNDYVFLLSLEEARTTIKGNPDRSADYEGKPSTWWLRSPGRDQNRAIMVYGDGHIYVRGTNVKDNDGGVRPVLWINL
ncbi:MAG: DUF6273 domain-containing protein [Defluviitaleaceae bacterium]|nr:DUF6273 domain-containing protein [Defluviitaleaceae bacterium]